MSEMMDYFNKLLREAVESREYFGQEDATAAAIFLIWIFKIAESEGRRSQK